MPVTIENGWHNKLDVPQSLGKWATAAPAVHGPSRSNVTYAHGGVYTALQKGVAQQCALMHASEFPGAGGDSFSPSFPGEILVNSGNSGNSGNFWEIRGTFRVNLGESEAPSIKLC